MIVPLIAFVAVVAIVVIYLVNNAKKKDRGNRPT